MCGARVISVHNFNGCVYLLSWLINGRQEKEDEFARNEGLEDEDREAFAEELEEEEDLLINLVDVIGQLVKLHGAALMPLIDASVVPSFAPFLAPDKPAALQVTRLSPPAILFAHLMRGIAVIACYFDMLSGGCCLYGR